MTTRGPDLNVPDNTCIVCDCLVEPGMGSRSVGPFPSIHTACLRRAATPSGLTIDDPNLRAGVQTLFEARAAISKAITGRPIEAIFAAVGMAMIDVLTHLKSLGPDAAEEVAVWLAQAREMGETIAQTATPAGRD